MSEQDFWGLVEYCQQLCRENQITHPSGVQERNEKIISRLVQDCSIEYGLAKEIFTNNNDPEALLRIYKLKFDVDKEVRKTTRTKREMISEETIYMVLSGLRDDPKAQASDFALSKEIFYKVLEIINDEGLAKGLKIKYADNRIYAIFRQDVRLTLKGISFLDNQKEPSTYAVDNYEKVNEEKVSIFLSYKWSNYAIADTVDEELSEAGYIVIRDIRDIRNWHSIKEFMRTIRKTDYVIILVSDEYLKSVNCMYEVGEVLKDENFKNRIFPFVIDESIYSIGNQMKYIKYWEDQNAELERQINRLSLANRASLTEYYRQCKEVEMFIGDFLKIICDMKKPEINELVKAVDKEIKKRNSNE